MDLTSGMARPVGALRRRGPGGAAAPGVVRRPGEGTPWRWIAAEGRSDSNSRLAITNFRAG